MKDTTIDFSIEIYILLTLVGFISGFINAIAGGGGLIVLPLMLWLGISPLNALATGKFQAVFGSLSSSINYFRKGFVDIQRLLPVMAFALVASSVGTYSVLQLSNGTLEQILPYFLIGVATYTLFSPTLNDKDYPPLMGYKTFVLIAGIGLGFYGGFFGPGIGALAALSFSSLLGYNLRKASANAKPVVVVINSVSVLVFMAGGHVLLWLGICMAVAQVMGAYLGSNLAIRKGARVIKPLLVSITFIIAFKLLWQL